MNEGRRSNFDVFWSFVEQVLQDYGDAAADDRRQGVAHMPLAVSIPDLKRKAIEKMTEEEKQSTAIPSDECVRVFACKCTFTV